MTTLPRRTFGNTAIEVSALGFGAGHIGDPSLAEREVEALCGAALDSGVNLFDTARSYGLSEERLGRAVAGRRGEVVLSTKIGYGIPGLADWTGECIRAGVDAALGRLRTDVLDIVHLHSCPREVLERGDVVGALGAAVRAGKARVAAYSGENEPLEWAVASGRFGSVQASVNVCDQASLGTTVAAAAARGLGVIAKRPLANAPWRFEHEPAAGDVAEYWRRFRALSLDVGELSWEELALRFAAFAPGVHTCIVGTRDVAHLRRAAAIVAKGPLPPDVVTRLRAAFAAQGAGWRGVV